MAEYKTIEQKRKFYDSIAWKHLRKQIRERDNNECMECKRQGRVFIDTGELNKKGTRKKIALIVHHKLELEDRPDLAFDVNNLETLCRRTLPQQNPRSLLSMARIHTKEKSFCGR